MALTDMATPQDTVRRAEMDRQKEQTPRRFEYSRSITQY